MKLKFVNALLSIPIVLFSISPALAFFKSDICVSQKYTDKSSSNQLEQCVSNKCQEFTLLTQKNEQKLDSSEKQCSCSNQIYMWVELSEQSIQKNYCSGEDLPQSYRGEWNGLPNKLKNNKSNWIDVYPDQSRAVNRVSSEKAAL